MGVVACFLGCLTSWDDWFGWSRGWVGLNGVDVCRLAGFGFSCLAWVIVGFISYFGLICGF